MLIEIPPASYGGTVPKSTAYEVDFLNGEHANWFVSNTSAAFAGRVSDVFIALGNEEQTKDRVEKESPGALEKYQETVRSAPARTKSQYFDAKLADREMGLVENTSPPVLPVPVAGAKSVTVELPQNTRLTPIVLQLRLKPVNGNVNLTDAKKRFKDGKGLILHAIPLPR